MNNRKLEKAFATIEKSMDKNLQNMENVNKYANQSEKELKNSFKKSVDTISALNKISGNLAPELEKCMRLISILTEAQSIEELPAQEEIDFCIRYATQENDPFTLVSIYGQLARVYEVAKEKSGTSIYNKEIYQYYCQEIGMLRVSIDYMERGLADKRPLQLLKTVFTTEIAGFSVLLYEFKQNMDIEYAKMGCKYAMENNDLQRARMIAYNFTLLYKTLGETPEKVLEISNILLGINMAIIDNGLKHDLNRCIEDAEECAAIYRDLSIVALRNDERERYKICKDGESRSYWHAAYYAEHSKAERRGDRMRRCAWYNYWCAKAGNLSTDSQIWQKAYQYARKFPTDSRCSMIMREYHSYQEKENQ